MQPFGKAGAQKASSDSLTIKGSSPITYTIPAPIKPPDYQRFLKSGETEIGINGQMQFREDEKIQEKVPNQLAGLVSNASADGQVTRKLFDKFNRWFVWAKIPILGFDREETTPSHFFPLKLILQVGQAHDEYQLIGKTLSRSAAPETYVPPYNDYVPWDIFGGKPDVYVRKRSSFQVGLWGGFGTSEVFTNHDFWFNAEAGALVGITLREYQGYGRFGYEKNETGKYTAGNMYWGADRSTIFTATMPSKISLNYKNLFSLALYMVLSTDIFSPLSIAENTGTAGAEAKILLVTVGYSGSSAYPGATYSFKADLSDRLQMGINYRDQDDFHFPQYGIIFKWRSPLNLNLP